MTGTLRSQTGFYCITDILAEFEKAMAYKLKGFKNAFCFFDDVLIVSKGSDEDHKQYLSNCLKNWTQKTLEFVF